MTGDQQPNAPDSRSEPESVAVPVLSLLAALLLLIWTTRLPFTAGSQLLDLLVPIGAVLAGALSGLTALRQWRHPGSSPRGGLLTVAILGWLVAGAGVFALIVIFGLCGAYWSATSC